MAIKRFGDYEKTKAYGTFNALPKGGYVMRILSADVKENSIGQYIEMQMDVSEGEFRDYFKNDYMNQATEDKKWHCIYFLNVPKDDGTEQDGWTKRRFKTFTEALEDSNPGYHFDWDESKFKGFLIGGLFNEREYEKSNGEVGRSANMASVCSIADVRNNRYTLPKDKLLSNKSSSGSTVNRSSGYAGGYTVNEDGFMNIPEGVEEELPFD